MMKRISLIYVIAAISLDAAIYAITPAQKDKKPFTVSDEIGIAYFGDPYISSFTEEAVRVSPDGKYFAVDTVRGQVHQNRIEDSLRFYRSQDIADFLNHPYESKPLSPMWIVVRYGGEAPIINSDWRWLTDSSGVAFLERISTTHQRLLLADIRKKTIEPLTSETETVKKFDICDRQNYVYTATDSLEQKKTGDAYQAPALVGTGSSLAQLLLPNDPRVVRASQSYTKPILWVVAAGKRFQMKHEGKPVVCDESLALSPDHHFLITVLPVSDVPLSWETLYPPPFQSSHYRIHAGHESAHQYVQINLQSGAIRSLTDAPTSNDAAWMALAPPSWSLDGQDILLPGTFLSSKNNLPSRPCLAIVDAFSKGQACVWRMKGHTGPNANEVEEGYHVVYGARFEGKGNDRVIVRFQSHDDGSYRSIEYRRTTDGTWEAAGQDKEVAEFGINGLEMLVQQGLNEPPRLVARNKYTSRIVWDPNPQLKTLTVSTASIYKWKDKEGRDVTGGLFKPSNYRPGHRYPLVIQTHGFMRTLFMPSGLFPTANAAQALAAVGIVVLQIEEPCPLNTPDEGPCAVSVYEAAANRLISEGLVDPERIGIIGFSRTCFYVMETLTIGSLHFKAASITDGVMETYVQYMLSPNPNPEADSIIGAKPFGKGLQQWLARSPGFKLDKVSTPLLVVAEGPFSLLSFMWDPYAGLRYLRKPVDLIMLNTDEHVLTNPAVRMVSQGGTVDWFRFWLQDYEDPVPAKAAQYARWRELRQLQVENGNNETPSRITIN
jgi:dipeptidyl aminopeptidase/acylaminoacyl peptidase